MPSSVQERRRAPRYDLGGVVELTDLESGQMKVALVRALSLYGCLVKTEMPVKEDAKVALNIAHSGSQFSARGRVVNCVGTQSNRGLGIEFTAIDPVDRTRLETCLSDWAVAHKIPAVPNP